MRLLQQPIFTAEKWLPSNVQQLQVIESPNHLTQLIKRPLTKGQMISISAHVPAITTAAYSVTGSF